MSTENEQFQRAVMEGLVPKVDGAAVCVSVVGEGDYANIDPEFCVQLGVMIMLDKPIIAVQMPGAVIPDKLRLVADEIVEADMGTSEGQAHFAERLAAFQERFES